MDIRNGHIYSAEQAAAIVAADPTLTGYFRPMALDPTPEQRRRGSVGRNDPCPCGSGRKFKRCCLFAREAEARMAAQQRAVDEVERAQAAEKMLSAAQINAAIRDLMRRKWAEEPPGERCFDRDAENADRLFDFLEGGADPAASEAVRGHLLECSRCRWAYAVAREGVLAGKGA